MPRAGDYPGDARCLAPNRPSHRATSTLPAAATARTAPDQRAGARRGIVDEFLDRFGDVKCADYTERLLLLHGDQLEANARPTRIGINRKIATLRDRLRWGFERGHIGGPDPRSTHAPDHGRGLPRCRARGSRRPPPRQRPPTADRPALRCAAAQRAVRRRRLASARWVAGGRPDQLVAETLVAAAVVRRLTARLQSCRCP